VKASKAPLQEASFPDATKIIQEARDKLPSEFEALWNMAQPHSPRCLLTARVRQVDYGWDQASFLLVLRGLRRFREKAFGFDRSIKGKAPILESPWTGF